MLLKPWQTYGSGGDEIKAGSIPAVRVCAVSREEELELRKCVGEKLENDSLLETKSLGGCSFLKVVDDIASAAASRDEAALFHS